MRTAIRFVLLFSTITTLHAQTQVQQPRFALEISEDGYPPHFVIVPEGQQAGGIDSMFFSPALHQLPGYGARNPEQRKPSAVELVCKMDGDAVAITASVVFGPFDPTETSVSLQGHPKQEIGTFSSHLRIDRFTRDGTIRIATVDHQGCKRAIARSSQSTNPERGSIHST